MAFVLSPTRRPQLISGSALTAIGGIGLVRSRRAQAPEVDRSETFPGTSLGRYVLFLGLTAINPATLAYFTAILAGLDQVSGSPSSAIAFIVGVGTSSFGWQSLLIALGAGLRRATGSSFQNWTAVIGHSIVVVLGVLLIAQVI